MEVKNYLKKIFIEILLKFLEFVLFVFLVFITVPLVISLLVWKFSGDTNISIFYIYSNVFRNLYKNSIDNTIVIPTIGAMVTAFFIYYRARILEKGLFQKEEHYIRESLFKNFLETSRLLTNKDSSIEAKISVLYLFYDYARQHRNDVEKVIQVLNKQLLPLFKVIEDGEYININNLISITDKNKMDKQIIKEWRYKGNDAEKLISNSLLILKKILLEISINKDIHGCGYLDIDISNSILFDIDIRFLDIRKLTFRANKIPMENIIFLYCHFYDNSKKSEKIVSFQNVSYYFA